MTNRIIKKIQALCKISDQAFRYLVIFFLRHCTLSYWAIVVKIAVSVALRLVHVPNPVLLSRLSGWQYKVGGDQGGDRQGARRVGGKIHNNFS